MRNSDGAAMTSGDGNGFSRRGVKLLAWAVLVVGTLVFLGSWLLAETAHQVMLKPSGQAATIGDGKVQLSEFIYYPAQFARYLALAALVAAVGVLMRWNWARGLLAAVFGILFFVGLALAAIIGISAIVGTGDSFGAGTAAAMALPCLLLAAVSWPLFRRIRSQQTLATFHGDAASRA